MCYLLSSRSNDFFNYVPCPRSCSLRENHPYTIKAGNTRATRTLVFVETKFIDIFIGFIHYVCHRLVHLGNIFYCYYGIGNWPNVADLEIPKKKLWVHLINIFSLQGVWVQNISLSWWNGTSKSAFPWQQFSRRRFQVPIGCPCAIWSRSVENPGSRSRANNQTIKQPNNGRQTQIIV